VAEAVVPAVAVFDVPDAPQPTQTLPNPNRYGAPLVFLVNEEPVAPENWLNVYLPVRPNGSTGWVRSSDVAVKPTTYSVVVALGSNELAVWDGDQLVHQELVGVGTNNTPTPTGLFYATALVQSNPEQQRKYGPYVYVLSGFSEVHLSFDGGDGEVGIHGTNNAANLGQDVSNGCIRMSNEGISKLAPMLPLGVPVEIRP
jgi:lipoprotein-anchoring transpeptidase ErfK/SrfK